MITMVILPSDGGDHAGEIDLAVEHNPLSWFHLVLTVIFLIVVMIMINMVIIDYNIVIVKMIQIMTYIHRHIVH